VVLLHRTLEHAALQHIEFESRDFRAGGTETLVGPMEVFTALLVVKTIHHKTYTYVASLKRRVGLLLLMTPRADSGRHSLLRRAPQDGCFFVVDSRASERLRCTLADCAASWR
jgi:hypothetical protein